MPAVDIVLRGRQQGVAAAFNRAEQSVKSFQRSTRSATATVRGFLGPLAAVASFRGAIQGFNTLRREIDETAKAARNAGLSIEEYQRLTFAFEQSGSSANVATRAIQQTARTVSEAGRGLATYNDALGSVGLSYEQLAELSPLEQFYAILDALRDTDDETTRLAAAQILLGRAGREMGTLIQGGSEAVRGLGDQLERAGGLVDEETAAQFEKYNDQLNLLNRRFTALFATLAENTGLLDFLLALTNALDVTVDGGDRLLEFTREYNEANDALSSSLGTDFFGTEAVIERFDELSRVAGESRSPIELFRQSLRDLGVDIGGQSESALYSRFKKALEAWLNFRSQLNANEVSETGDAVKKTADATGELATNLTAAEKAEQARLEASLASLAADRERAAFALETAGLSADEVERARLYAAIRSAQTKEEADRLREILDLVVARQNADAVILAEAERQAAAEQAAADAAKELADQKQRERDLQVEIADVILTAENNTQGYLRALGQILVRLRRAKEEGSSIRDIFGGGGEGGGGGGLGFLAGLFGGRRQFGGPVSPGTAYLVGERGPELYVPNIAGSIVPGGGARRGGDMHVTQNFRPNYVGNVTDSVRRTNAADLRNQALAARLYLEEERL